MHFFARKRRSTIMSVSIPYVHLWSQITHFLMYIVRKTTAFIHDLNDIFQKDCIIRIGFFHSRRAVDLIQRISKGRLMIMGYCFKLQFTPSFLSSLR